MSDYIVIISDYIIIIYEDKHIFTFSSTRSTVIIFFRDSYSLVNNQERKLDLRMLTNSNQLLA